MSDIHDFVWVSFHIDVVPNTLHHILCRDCRVKPCPAVPMEDARVDVTEHQIQEHFEQMFQKISGIPAHFVFNMDEMGHQEWADAKGMICFVPASYGEDLVHYPVSRAGKRITLIGCIGADGSFLRPNSVTYPLRGIVD